MHPRHRLFMIGLLCVIVACQSETALPSPPSPSATPPPSTPAASPAAGTAPVALASEVALPERLDPAPQDCPASPAPQEIAPELFGAGVGGAPVWAIGFGGTPPTLSLDPDAPRTPHGWQRKVLWVVESAYQGAITLRGGSLSDDSLIWFDYKAHHSEPTPFLLLESGNPEAGRDHAAWREFRGYLLLPKADCYFLEAKWPEGHWRITFAAGRAPASLP